MDKFTSEIKLIRETDIIKNGSAKNSYLFKKRERGYSIPIFAICFESNSDLNENWERITNNISIMYQIQNRDIIQIEKINFYIFFFVKTDVDKILKYNIEGDTFCARKYVYSMIYDLKDVEEIIWKRLFDIQINMVSVKENISILDDFKKKFPNIYNRVKFDEN